MNRFFVVGLCFSSMLIAGCGGATEEIAPTKGGKSTATDEEIKKQMEESMKKSGGHYKGKAPAGK